MAGNNDFGADARPVPARSNVRRVVGLVAVVVVAGAVTGARIVTGGAANTTPAPATPARAAAPAAKAAAAKTTPAKAAVRPGTTRAGTRAQLASTDGNGAPVVTAVPQNGSTPGSSAVHLDEHLTYQYDALGRRDPFQSLVDGQFIGVDVGGDAPPDPGGIKVVGIVWGASDQFALVEDVRGNSFVLRKGDKVQNGVVEGLKRDGVIVNITAEGQTQSVVIPLVRKGDSNAR